MQLHIIISGLFFLYGIIIGSFVNVCIYRIPQKENITTTRSHCMACGHTLAWYDMFPLFSWIFLRGKCRYCGTEISAQYPLVEFLNGVGYVWIYLVMGCNSFAILYCLVFSVLLALSVIDWRTYEIPPSINFFIFVVGIIASFLDFKQIGTHLVGFFCVSLFLLILYYATKGRGIGGGDVKLMAAAGLLIGWQNIILALIIGSIVGSVIHLLRMRISGKDHILAFGPYLSVGIFIAMLYGNDIVHWYLSIFSIT